MCQAVGQFHPVFETLVHLPSFQSTKRQAKSRVLTALAAFPCFSYFGSAPSSIRHAMELLEGKYVRDIGMNDNCRAGHHKCCTDNLPLCHVNLLNVNFFK
jgi:hypothetical protein